MSRDDRPMRVPKYRRHPNGQAMVQYRSKRYYLGKYGTAESRKRYQAFLSRIEESAPTAAELESVGRDVTIAKLIFLYSAYCRDYYGASPEYNNLIQALRPLEKLWGLTLGRDFGPRKLIAVRDHMVRSGLARKNINRLVSRIKRFWRWCCMMELVPQEIYHGLLSVSPLMPGRCNVRESPEVLPVPLDVVRATLPWLSPTIRALVQVQLYCGMRPSEACRMRGADIDTSGPVWLYRPPKHKGAWRNKPRVIAVPKVAQDILRSLMPDDSERYIFSPREAERQRMEARAEAAARTGKQRKTKVYPCELRRRAREKLARRARERKR
ncbi:MAG TPA: tyrosine-type recombinase/integrase, partial [Pirellulales bacterium]|nr:tyrosine-type recombinase/integrase [Pirellulales bacterium]